jgi:hypothetical protein
VHVRGKLLLGAGLLALADCDRGWTEIRAPYPAFEIREVVDKGDAMDRLKAASASPAGSAACIGVDFRPAPEPPTNQYLGDLPYATAKKRAPLLRCAALVKDDDVEIVIGSLATMDGTESYQTYVVASRPVIAGSDVRRARISGSGDHLFLQLELASDAARRLTEFTRAHVKGRMALITNGNVDSTPRILSAIDDRLISIAVVDPTGGSATLRRFLGR